MATKRQGRGQGMRGAGATAPKRKVGPRAENVRAVFYVKPVHLDALEELAKEQAKQSGALRPDLSKAARTALDEWLVTKK
jgi:hypothetical protein